MVYSTLSIWRELTRGGSLKAIKAGSVKNVRHSVRSGGKISVRRPWVRNVNLSKILKRLVANARRYSLRLNRLKNRVFVVDPATTHPELGRHPIGCIPEEKTITVGGVVSIQYTTISENLKSVSLGVKRSLREMAMPVHGVGTVKVATLSQTI